QVKDNLRLMKIKDSQMTGVTAAGMQIDRNQQIVTVNGSVNQPTMLLGLLPGIGTKTLVSRNSKAGSARLSMAIVLDESVLGDILYSKYHSGDACPGCPTRIQAAKSAIKSFLATLMPADNVSIITYSADCTVNGIDGSHDSKVIVP